MGMGVSFLFFFLGLPFLIGLWIGVVALGRIARPGHWWCMLAGGVLVSFSMIVQPLLVILMMQGSAGGGSMAGFMRWNLMASGLSGLGYLLFGVGFALHGLMAKRSKDRFEELEMVMSAQQEELERVRNS